MIKGTLQKVTDANHTSTINYNQNFAQQYQVVFPVVQDSQKQMEKFDLQEGYDSLFGNISSDSNSIYSF